MDWLIAPDSVVWLWLGRGSVVLGYVAIFTIGAYIFDLFGYRRRRKQMGEVSGKTAYPKALALCFGGGSIEVPVERYLSEAYPEHIEVESYEAEEITPENVHKHTEALRRIKEKLQSEGVTELHLFMKGPVALALAAGAIFDNWVSVKVYQHPRDQHAGEEYVPWVTLAQAKAAPLRDELGELLRRRIDPSPGAGSSSSADAPVASASSST